MDSKHAIAFLDSGQSTEKVKAFTVAAYEQQWGNVIVENHLKKAVVSRTKKRSTRNAEQSLSLTFINVHQPLTFNVTDWLPNGNFFTTELWKVS